MYLYKSAHFLVPPRGGIINMKKTLSIQTPYSDAVANIALDTINKKKQALVFVNSKRGAEAQAERISLKIKEMKNSWHELSESSLKALPKPTRQCERLSRCLSKGIAFHHSGLHKKQRELVENAFRKGTIGIICATPTLALGMNLPSFRTIVRDLKRYGPGGYNPIPVLEYMQFIGRSGRPDFNDKYGEAVTIAETDGQKESIVEKYIKGDPEEIYSKLALEPVLRMYMLTLIASEFCTTKKSLLKFFEKTFYGHQYGNIKGLKKIIDKILFLLEDWEFIKPGDDFISANQKADDKLEATPIGKRVSELYLDPYTAHILILGMRKATKKANTFSYLNLLTNCLEMRPLLNVKVSEYDEVEQKTVEQPILVQEPDQYDDSYEIFLKTIKTAMFLESWIEEKTEEYLLEAYGIRPGEIFIKLERCDWLIYASTEIARIQQFAGVRMELYKLRQRLKYGVKEELLTLLKLKNIGRVRSRMLFKNGIKTIEDVKKADYPILAQLLGKQIALDVKKQVGQDFSKVKVKPRKRKGQKNLKDY